MPRNKETKKEQGLIIPVNLYEHPKTGFLSFSRNLFVLAKNQ